MTELELSLNSDFGLVRPSQGSAHSRLRVSCSTLFNYRLKAWAGRVGSGDRLNYLIPFQLCTLYFGSDRVLNFSLKPKLNMNTKSSSRPTLRLSSVKTGS